MMKQIINSLSIYFIRIVPMLFMLVCGICYIDIIISFNEGNFTEFFHESGVFLYMQYDMPLYNILNDYFNYSYITLIPFYILSYKLAFCKYHRIALHYLVLNLFMVQYFSEKLTTETTMAFCISGLVILACAIGLVVYLYLKRKPSKR